MKMNKRIDMAQFSDVSDVLKSVLGYSRTRALDIPEQSFDLSRMPTAFPWLF